MPKGKTIMNIDVENAKIANLKTLEIGKSFILETNRGNRSYVIMKAHFIDDGKFVVKDITTQEYKIHNYYHSVGYIK